MFPGRDPETIAEVLQATNRDLMEAVDCLLCEDFPSIPSSGSVDGRQSSVGTDGTTSSPAGQSNVPLEQPCCSRREPIPSAEVTVDSLLRQSSEAIDFVTPLDIVVRRDHVWRNGFSVYKNTVSDPSKLMKDLRIEFEGQEGIDAGALKLDFFELLLGEINTRLFTGLDTRRVPKKDWGLESAFEVAGCVIAHSLLVGGPSFACLCPAVYSYIVFGDVDRALSEGLTIEDILLDAASCTLLEFLRKVQCNSIAPAVQALCAGVHNTVQELCTLVLYITLLSLSIFAA